MFHWLLLLFIVLPIVELTLLIKVGTMIHAGPTVAIVLVTGITGAALARRQGLQTLSRIRAQLASGAMPTTQLAEGFMILLAGALLITPGFLTDLFGFGLLIPGCRRWLIRILRRHFESTLIQTHAQAGGDDTWSFADSYDSARVDAQTDTHDQSNAHSVKYVKNEASKP